MVTVPPGSGTCSAPTALPTQFFICLAVPLTRANTPVSSTCSLRPYFFTLARAALMVFVLAPYLLATFLREGNCR